MKLNPIALSAIILLFSMIFPASLSAQQKDDAESAHYHLQGTTTEKEYGHELKDTGNGHYCRQCPRMVLCLNFKEHA